MHMITASNIGLVTFPYKLEWPYIKCHISQEDPRVY